MITHAAGFADRTHDFVLADGRTLGYGLYGADDGPLVVVLDGPGSRGLARAMASPATQLGIKLLAPDRPGFGSSSPAPNHSIAAISGDLLALVDHLGFRRFGLVAQSGGTPYALAVAAAGGDRVTGLAFIGGMAPLDAPHALQDVARPMRIAGLLARRAPWLLRLLLNALSRQTAKDPEGGGAQVCEAHAAGRSSRARGSSSLGDPRPQLSRDRVAPGGRRARDAHARATVEHRLRAHQRTRGAVGRRARPQPSPEHESTAGQAPRRGAGHRGRGRLDVRDAPLLPRCAAPRRRAARGREGRAEGKRRGRNPLPATKRSDRGPIRRADSRRRR